MIHNIDRICINCMKEKTDRDAVCPYCGYDPKIYQPVPTHLPPFTILYGKYVLGRVIGQGGFGIVYIALDLVLEIVVAIKELFPARMVTRTITNQSSSNTVSCTDDPRNLAVIREKFVKEARTIIRLQEAFNAEGIVQVRDLFEDNNTVYLVMEYLQGKSLKQYCEENGTIHYPQLIQMLRPIMDSLELMHGVDVLHRDISADNIMVLSSGSSRTGSSKDVPQLKLLDFGNVKVQDSANDVSRSMVMAVKRGYSPIEQYSSDGQIGSWTDVYAMCATIYFCLTGKVPPEPAVLAGTSITLPSRLGADIPDSAEKILMKGLAFRHSDRIQNMHDLIAGLYVVIPEPEKDQRKDSGKEQGKNPGKYNTSESPVQGKSKLPLVIGIPVGVVFLIGAVMAVIYFNKSGQGNVPQAELSKTVIVYQSETTEIIEIDSEQTEYRIHVSISDANTVEETQNQEEVDQRAADEVMKAIIALPSKITLDDEETVKAAREGYDSLTEEQKKLVPYLTYLQLTTSEDHLKKIKSEEEQKKKESEKQQQAIPISLSLDDFYVVSSDPESILYKGKNVLTFLQDEFGGEGSFWSFNSISDMDKDYYVTTNRGLNNNYPSKADILEKYGKGVDIPIDKDSDIIYQSMKENGDFEADIIDQCSKCVFYNYEDQGQLVFYMNEDDLCELIMIESGISFYADKNTVKSVQKKLNSKGYDCGKTDGVAGEKTRSAVKKYQEENGLFPSGLVDDSLLKSLET